MKTNISYAMTMVSSKTELGGGSYSKSSTFENAQPLLVLVTIVAITSTLPSKLSYGTKEWMYYP